MQDLRSVQQYFLINWVPKYGHKKETYLALSTGGRSIRTVVNIFALEYLHIKIDTFKISIHKTNLIFLVHIVKSKK